MGSRGNSSAPICGKCGADETKRVQPDSLRARFELRSPGCFWLETLRRAEIPPAPPPPRGVINAGVYVSRRAPAASACACMCAKRAACMLVIPVEYEPGRGNDVRSVQTTILIRTRVAMRFALWIRARILSNISVLSFIRGVRGVAYEQGIIIRRENRDGFPLSKISIRRARMQSRVNKIALSPD